MKNIKSEVEKIISQPNDVFNLQKYQEARRLAAILRLEALKIDSWLKVMAQSCEHVSTRTEVENHYTTTRCNDCRYVLSSKPLPGIE